ncbi:hypothetical protein IGI39_000364 [Enterococcus sp. AZ135]|uniref:YwqH-like family protein n=1 Tax=unclassified Enterococcus TaxID=2608891 RepID=UPI003F27E702
MSEANIKQAEALESRAKQNQLKLNEVNANKKILNDQIEILEKAKSELTATTTSLTSFSTSVSSELKSIDSGSFQGTRRDEYNTKVSDVATELTKIADKHKENQDALDKKLAELKENSQRLGMSIGTLSSNIANLTAEAKRLRAQ